MAATQGHMQDRALLGGVDGVTPKHGLGLGHHRRFIGQRQQLLHHLVVDALAGVIDGDASAAGVKLLKSLWILKQVPQMRLGMVCKRLKRFPSLAVLRRCELDHGAIFVKFSV